MKITGLSALKIAKAVNNDEISALDLIKEATDYLKDFDQDRNVFAHLAPAEAEEQAALVDQKISSGLSLPLAGVPLVADDSFAFKKMPASFSSGALKNYHPPFSAAAMEKLMGAGMVVVGKTKTGDMGLDLKEEAEPEGHFFSGALQAVKGSASATSAGFLMALTSDASGVSRQEAARFNVYGLRPTPGRVSRFGLSLSCPSFDYPGFAAARLSDLAVLLQAASGFDERDLMTNINLAPREKIDDCGVPEKTVIGFSSSLFSLLEPKMRQVYEKRIALLEEEGFEVIDLPLNILPQALRAYYVIALAEASSNLSRFDGIRFGLAAEADDLEEYYFKTRRLTFGAEACRRVLFGTFVLSGAGFERYYQKALKVASLTRQTFGALFERCTFMLLPLFCSSSSPQEADFIEVYEENIFTAPVNMTGLPVLSLPEGLQLLAPPFRDEGLLALGRRLGKAPGAGNPLQSERGPASDV